MLWYNTTGQAAVASFWDFDAAQQTKKCNNETNSVVKVAKNMIIIIQIKWLFLFLQQFTCQSATHPQDLVTPFVAIQLHRTHVTQRHLWKKSTPNTFAECLSTCANSIHTIFSQVNPQHNTLCRLYQSTISIGFLLHSNEEPFELTSENLGQKLDWQSWHGVFIKSTCYWQLTFRFFVAWGRPNLLLCQLTKLQFQTTTVFQPVEKGR